MYPYVIWFVLAFGLVVAELFTGTFYLLMIGIACAAGGFAALVGLDLPMQLVIGAALGIALTIALRQTRWGKLQPQGDALSNRDVILDIGETVYVSAWHEGIAKVQYRGAQWDATLEPGAMPMIGPMMIRAIRGSTLILAPALSQTSSTPPMH